MSDFTCRWCGKKYNFLTGHGGYCSLRCYRKAKEAEEQDWAKKREGKSDELFPILKILIKSNDSIPVKILKTVVYFIIVGIIVAILEKFLL